MDLLALRLHAAGAARGALFTGLAAPAVGTYLVQRRLALMGDGIGHVAVTGVGARPAHRHRAHAHRGRRRGRSAPSLIELIRERGRTSGDVALALLFYGGIAGGVLLTGLAGQSAATLQHLPVRLDHHDLRSDVWVTVGARGGRRRWSRRRCRPQLFAVAQDEEFARVSRAAGAGLQPAGRGAGRGDRHRRDAHRRACCWSAR